jgi:gliding motility-associated-like protein
MKGFFTILIIVFCFAQTFVYGQGCGFEDGTMSGWRLSNGKLTDDGFNTIYSGEVQGTVGSGHIITKKNDGRDPKISTEVIPMVAPESDYSVRFGNINTGGSFYRLSKSFTVSQENTLFQYKFAVVLQDDSRGHFSYQKPGFGVKIMDINGSNITCSFYDVQLQASASVDGFKRQGDLEYRNWTTVAVDLRAYIGQVITVEATVHGCTKMAHYGYAYFYANCLKSEVQPETGCEDANGKLTLEAPEGFEKYAWSTGGTTRAIQVNAILGTQFSVKLTPYNSLSENCNLEMNYTVKKTDIPDITDKVICVGESFVYRKKTYNTTGKYVENKSNSAFCDSVFTLNLKVNPINYITKDIKICEGETFSFKGTGYNSTGKYFKTIKSTDVCDSVFTLNVKVVTIPRITKDFGICEGENVKVGDSTYSKSGKYVTTIKRTGLCDSVVTSTVKIENAFVLSVSPTEANIEKGEKTEIKVSVNPSGNYTYNWTPKDFLTCSTCPSAFAEPSSSTRYTISVSELGSRCFKKIDSKVNVIAGVFVPTAFTPNGDSVNDIFYIIGSKSVRQIKEMIIYNRWGELIFRDENFQTGDPSHGWDGNYRGQTLNSDIFSYKIIADMKNGEVNDFSGAFTLLK